MPSGLTDRHMGVLWERMAKIYGHKWVSSYGEEDDGTWLTGLHDVTPEQIGVGLEACRVSAEPWPPTLPQFRAMCLPSRPLCAAHRIALPAPAVPREARAAMADQFMPQLREVLK